MIWHFWDDGPKASEGTPSTVAKRSDPPKSAEALVSPPPKQVEKKPKVDQPEPRALDFGGAEGSQAPTPAEDANGNDEKATAKGGKSVWSLCGMTGRQAG